MARKGKCADKLKISGCLGLYLEKKLPVYTHLYWGTYLNGGNILIVDLKVLFHNLIDLLKSLNYILSIGVLYDIFSLIISINL